MWGNMDKKLFITFVIFVIILLFGLASYYNITTSKTINQDPIERIYNADPYRQYIGTEVENHKFTDIITGNAFEIKDFANKLIIFESFSVGCPACAEGIRNYNQIYDKYGKNAQIIYLNINPADTEQDIKNIKQKYNGRDWIWVKFSPEIKDFLLKYDIVGNDITYIVKDSKIVYADSLSAPVSRIENSIIKVI